MNGRRRYRGSILIFTLWILVCLSLIALGFGRRARLEVRAAAYEMDCLTARLLARSAVELGMAALREDFGRSAEYDALNESWAGEHEVDVEQIVGEAAAGFSEGATVTFTIVDENRKLNINRASADLLDNFEMMPSAISGEIIARRLGEDTFSSSDDYTFIATEELLQFKKFEVSDWLDTPSDSGLRFCDAITVYGSGKININTAPVEVISAIPGLRRAVAEDIVAYRRGPDGIEGTGDDNTFRAINEIRNVPRIMSSEVSLINRYCELSSSAFTVTGKAQLHNGRVTAVVRAVVRHLASPKGKLAWREG